MWCAGISVSGKGWGGLDPKREGVGLTLASSYPSLKSLAVCFQVGKRTYRDIFAFQQRSGCHAVTASKNICWGIVGMLDWRAGGLIVDGPSRVRHIQRQFFIQMCLLLQYNQPVDSQPEGTPALLKAHLRFFIKKKPAA